MNNIYTKFVSAVESRKMILPGDRILLSLSAGKDSMAMLDLMQEYRKSVHFDMGVFHLNHLTRGIESDSDADFVRDKSSLLNVSFFGMSFDFKKGKISGTSFEEQARDVRYSMLTEICESNGYNKIAIAHNSNDNAETVLMRIFSGTGIYGLRGISRVTGKIIRPILDITPDEIYSYLKEKKIGWREDHTNAENLYLRNYTRNVIIPAVKEKFHEAEKNINRLAELADENENLLSFLAGTVNPGWMSKTGTGIRISVEGFQDNIPFIKYMLSRGLISEFGIKLNTSILNEITRRFLTEKSNLTLYEKDNIQISKRMRENGTLIEIADLTKMKPLPEEWEYDLPVKDKYSVFIPETGKYINYRLVGNDEYHKIKKTISGVFIRSDAANTVLKLRNRRDGDRIRLENGTKKIKDLMIEKKLDINTKKSVPLLIVNGEVAAYLPGAVESYPDRVSCNFWVDHCTESMFVFYFTDLPEFDIINQ